MYGVRKVYVELPREGSLVFTQNEGVGGTSTDLLNYAEATMFLRDENGIERCGMVRLNTKYGFKITHDGELLADISTKTDEEEIYEQQTKTEAERVKRNDALFWSRNRKIETGSANDSGMFKMIRLDDLHEISPEKKEKLKHFMSNIERPLGHMERYLKILKEKTPQLVHYFKECKKECNKPALKGFTNFFYYEMTDRWHSYLGDETCILKINRKIKSLERLVSNVSWPFWNIEMSYFIDLEVSTFIFQSNEHDFLNKEGRYTVEIQDLYARRESLISGLDEIKKTLVDLCASSKKTSSDEKMSLQLELASVHAFRNLEVSLKSNK